MGRAGTGLFHPTGFRSIGWKLKTRRDLMNVPLFSPSAPTGNLRRGTDGSITIELFHASESQTKGNISSVWNLRGT